MPISLPLKRNLPTRRRGRVVVSSLDDLDVSYDVSIDLISDKSPIMDVYRVNCRYDSLLETYACSFEITANRLKIK